MAEAMINHEYLATSLPTLQPSEGRGGMIIESNHNNNNNQAVEESERSCGKSVVFDLPPSPKRQKISTTTTKMLYSSNDNKLTYQMIITNIQQSVSRTSRCDALSAACESFNHNDEGLHDEEIEFGVDLALCKHLGYLLFQKTMMKHDEYQDCNHSNNYNHHYNDEPVEISILPVDNSTGGREEQMEEELSQTCKAMEMVYRCSADSIHSSFNRIGKDLLPLLIHIIQQDLDDRNLPLTSSTPSPHDNHHHNKNTTTTPTAHKNNDDDDSITTASSVHATEQRQESSNHHTHHISSNNHKNKHLLAKKDLCLKSCTKIMGHFARVGALTEPLAYHPKVLSTLKRLVSCYHRTSVAAVPIEARLNALWTIANLACNVENMVMMACHPGLIDTLLQVSKHSPQEDPQQPQQVDDNNTNNILEYMELLRSRSIAVRAILNLSWAPENKIPFAEHTDLVHTLLRTVIHRTSSWGGHGKGVSAILLQSRRHAAGALRNLAAAPRRTKRFLCCQSKNSFDLLKKLADIAQNDPDQAVKDRIHATFHNLVCADTAEIYTANQDVMKVLQEAASKGNARINYQAQDSHNMALRTLRTLEKAIPEDLDAYKTLRPIIDSVEDSLKHCESRN